jgi:hypothetical protein
MASGEFRALWTAQVLSVAGDQLARMTLTLLVYDPTRSSLLAAVTFVASLVPQFLGGVALAGLADRWPRREFMIVCDVARAVLVLIMALPGVPVAGLVGLLFVVTLVGAPFTAARAALYPDILAGDAYVLGIPCLPPEIVQPSKPGWTKIDRYRTSSMPCHARLPPLPTVPSHHLMSHERSGPDTVSCCLFTGGHRVPAPPRRCRPGRPRPRVTRYVAP